MRHLFGIPDYDECFKGFFDEEVSGTDDIQEMRIEGTQRCQRTGLPTNIQVHYKVDVRMTGYLPRYLFALVYH